MPCCRQIWRRLTRSVSEFPLREGDSTLDTKALSFRQLRAIWIALLVAAVVYIRIGETIKGPLNGQIKAWHWAIAALAAYGPIGAYIVRRKLMTQANALRASGNDLAAGRKWSAGQLVAIASSEAVVLWGLVARCMGSPAWLAPSCYFVGIMLLICYRPRPWPASPP
jgi:hypothetical protein